MPEISDNNRRIARNTLMLYVRMFCIMAVSLFTSRIVLKSLGVEDFGVYNVVGGVVAMFSFLNGGMVSATQRYLSFEVGKGDRKRLDEVFASAVRIHFFIAVIVLLLAETAGLWFLLHRLVIPAGRETAAMWVYQASVLSCMVNIMSVPYNADIIAHEKMSAFAWISVVEVGLKLLVALSLSWLPFDRLKTYAVLILTVYIIVRLIYTVYCRRRYPESTARLRPDRQLVREMFSFAGWSFLGNFSSVLYTQGVNILLNIFAGSLANAARGVAVQVQGMVQQFVTGFQTALNPQITKYWSAGNRVDMHRLMFRSARFSFCLLYMIVLPAILEMPFVLDLWLVEVPRDAVVFTRLMLLISLAGTFANPCIIANQATGKVRKYQIVVGGILLLIVPVSWAVLKAGAPLWSVFLVHLVVESVAQLSRMIMLRGQIGIRIRTWLKSVYLPVAGVALLSAVLPLLLHCLVPGDWARLSAVVLSSVLSVSIATYFIGLTASERSFVRDRIKTALHGKNR